MGLHKDVGEDNMHEPKGVTTALADKVYVADGAGSGSWKLRMGTSVKLVNSVTDLPTAAGGKHTLVANTTYLITGPVVTPDYLDVSAGDITITALNSGPLCLDYTGTGDLFVGVDATFALRDIHITCPTANIFNMSATDAERISVSDVTCDACLQTGTITGLDVISFLSFSAVSCTQGLRVIGTGYRSVRIERTALISTEVTFIGVDITGAISGGMRLANMLLAGGAGSIGIKGDAASANITANNSGAIEDINFNGVTTGLVGITSDDIRWKISGNSITPDTMPDALISMTANATSTVLTVSTPTIVLGTFTEERVSHFTSTAAGRVTYVGERPLTTPIDACLTLDPDSGTNKVVRAYIAINGAIVVNSGKAVRIDTADPREITLFWQVQLVANDYIEIWIENETDSIDFTVVDAILRVR